MAWRLKAFVKSWQEINKKNSRNEMKLIQIRKLRVRGYTEETISCTKEEKTVSKSMSKNEEGKKVEELKFKSKDDKPNYEQIYRN